MSKALQDALVAETRQATSDYERGVRAGRLQAANDLRPLLLKMSSEAAEGLLAEVRDREEFRGQVIAHAAGAALLRYKQSMAAGFCWHCGIRPPVAASVYRRCAECDRIDS